jgi:hypothetical protein
LDGKTGKYTDFDFSKIKPNILVPNLLLRACTARGMVNRLARRHCPKNAPLRFAGAIGGSLCCEFRSRSQAAEPDLLAG